MSLSYEEGIESLASMFPEMDKSSLQTILAANDYHLEQTVEAILASSGGLSSGYK